jgi:hypothetical protein
LKCLGLNNVGFTLHFFHLNNILSRS